MSKWLKGWSAHDQHQALLVCFPCAGAGVSVFNGLQEHLSPEINAIGVQLPGREERIDETPTENLELIVNAVFESLKKYPPLPMVFLGYSNGALLAYDVAKRLEEQQRPLAHFVIVAKKAPHMPKNNPPIRHLPDPEFTAKLRQYDYLPAALLANQKLMQLLVPRFRADLAISEQYQADLTFQLAVPYSCLSGSLDANATPADMRAWQDLITGDQHQLSIKAGHMLVREQPTQVADAINAAIKKILA